MKKHIFTMTDEAYENILDEALIDSYGDDEQIASFCAYLQNETKPPIYGDIAGAPVQVVDFTNDSSRVAALVDTAGKHYEIDLMSIEFESSPLPIAVYRKWREDW